MGKWEDGKMWRPGNYLDYAGLDGGESVERVTEENLPLHVKVWVSPTVWMNEHGKFSASKCKIMHVLKCV